MNALFGNLDLVKVLQIGFTGFGFLLALLSYMLISTEQKKTSPSDAILAGANRYMWFALALAVLSIISSVASSLLTTHPEKQSSADRKLYILGTVEDSKGPLMGVKVSLRRSGIGQAGSVTGPLEEIVTDQMGVFELRDVSFGEPDDHYRITIQADHHQPQQVILGPSGALSMRTFLVDSTEAGGRP